ncbi:MAG TPA: LysM domain-containing protein [Solirubrobacter sp.]
MRFRLAAGATVALWMVVCLTGNASAAAIVGGKTIAEASIIDLNTSVKGQLYDGAFYSGYSVAFYSASFNKGDRITIRTRSYGGDSPPCQIIYLPGTDDLNVGATSPLLNPTSSSRNESKDVQRFEPVPEDGGYVIAMTNADIFLSAPLQCLDAPSGRPFTFKVTVAHRGSVARSEKKKGGTGDTRADEPDSSGGGHVSTQVIEPGQSLWAIAESLFGGPASVAQVAVKVDRLWKLNAVRIGSGNPDLIYPGLKLRLK